MKIGSIYENAVGLDRMLGAVLDDEEAGARIAAVPPAAGRRRRLNMAPLTRVPATIQERAWSSPISFTPAK